MSICKVLFEELVFDTTIVVAPFHPLTIAMAASDDTKCDPVLTEEEFGHPTHSSNPAIAPALPFYISFLIALRLWIFKLTVSFALLILRLSHRKYAPTFTKYYDVRPKLECRIFLPPNTDIQSDKKLPTYLSIHGGGFVLCDPSVDDRFAHTFAQKNHILVISLNYSKSPQYRFPNPTNDIVALTNAILCDPLLPIDPTRVCLGGFSAGGNLALSAALHPSLKSRLSALLPIYPVVDFSGTYKGTFRKSPSGEPDVLERTGKWFQWAYIPEGMDRRHPLLSPVYAPRSAFGVKMMFFVGAEYDYLCTEAHAMASKLAGRKWSDGVDISEIDDDWDEKGVKWRMWRGQQHGFTHTRKSGDVERSRKKATEELYAEMGRFLREDVWSGKDGLKEANGRLVDI